MIVRVCQVLFNKPTIIVIIITTNKYYLTFQHFCDILALLEKLEIILGRHLKVTEEGFARKNSHELQSLLRLLDKEAKTVLEKLLVIIETCKDDKIVADAALKFLNFHREVAKDINQDKLQRLIANVKYGGPRQLSTEDDEDTPKIDFTNIQEA